MLIRFMPDTWLDAVVRPIGMAVPAGGIYVETIAPDFRFVFVLALLLAWLAWRVRARAAAARTLALLAFCAASFVPWLATTGNGRYFLLTLLLVGPLCVALVHHLPFAQRIRLGLAGLMLGLQAALLLQVQPWNSWGLAPWREGPAFAIDVPDDVKRQPATYITLPGITYSLVAHEFHPDSRWINLSAQRRRPQDYERSLDLLAASQRAYVLFPSLPGQGRVDSRLPEDLAAAMDRKMSEFLLRLDRGHACRLLPSRGLTGMGVRPGEGVPEKPEEQRGFWMCPVIRVPAADKPVLPAPPAEVEAAFAALERQCPRFFPPGATTSMLPMGARRFYPDSDMRAYVLKDGRVMYKYMRALNHVVVGTAAEVVLPSFHMDCSNIRGRAGLPWEREI